MPLTLLVGRDREVGTVLSLLDRPELRLLTLTGPGGAGKTRLALAVSARLLDRFEDGVHFVDLAVLRDPDLVPSTIARALGVHETGDEPLIESLQRHLNRRSVLLVLDNFEQLLAAAPVVAVLLHACPRLKMLVTSRAALRLTGEHELPVPPLAVPDLSQLPDVDVLTQYEAVALFIQRARAVRPDFQVTTANAAVIARICTRLDGLPLAIELAAARVKLLPPQALLARLGNRLALLTGGTRDRPARQQTLRSTIDWSYELLDPSARLLFARLAVFVGGCTLESIEAVCDGVMRDEGRGTSEAGRDSPLVPHPSALDAVEALVNESLLRPLDAGTAEARFGMLETIREYALERLEASGEAETVRARHAHWYLALLEAAEAGYKGAEQRTWLERVAIEHDNARAALGWAIERQDAGLALRLAGALGPFWLTRGQLAEAQGWLERALALAPDDVSPERARALNVVGNLAFYRGDHATATSLHQETLGLWRTLQDRSGEAGALHNLARAFHYQEAYDRAAELYQQSLDLWRELDDPRGQSVALNSLGVLMRNRGDLAAARTLYEQSLTLSREAEDAWSQAVLLNNLARITRDLGEMPRTRALCSESLELFAGLGDQHGITWVLSNLAIVAQRQGAWTRAARLVGATEAIRETIGAASLSLSPGELSAYAEAVVLIRDHLGPTVFASHQAATRVMASEQLLELARAAASESVEPSPVPGGHPSSPGSMTAGTEPDPLTRREGEVAALVARGLTNREIAAELVIAEGTVGVHLERIFGKLGVRSRAQLAVWVVERRLSTTDPE